MESAKRKWSTRLRWVRQKEIILEPSERFQLIVRCCCQMRKWVINSHNDTMYRLFNMKIKSCLTVNSLLDLETQFFKTFFQLLVFSSLIRFFSQYHLCVILSLYKKNRLFLNPNGKLTLSAENWKYSPKQVLMERELVIVPYRIYPEWEGSVVGFFTFPFPNISFCRFGYLNEFKMLKRRLLRSSGFPSASGWWGPGRVFIYTPGKPFPVRLLHGLGRGLVVIVVPH